MTIGAAWASARRCLNVPTVKSDEEDVRYSLHREVTAARAGGCLGTGPRAGVTGRGQ